MDFLHPDELRAALPLSIGRQGCSDEELQEIRSAVMFIFVCLCVGNCEYFMTFSEAVVKYSVKTCHPHFYNQVRGSRWLSIRGQFLETFFSATHSCLPKHYSVLHFQLYHGADEYGVAGSWLSDALNTNIHTFEVGKVLTWSLLRWAKYCLRSNFQKITRWRPSSSSLSTVCLDTSGSSLTGGSR